MTATRAFGFQSAIRNHQSAISFLALRAVVAAAASDYDALDRHLADQTGLSFAAVDAVLELEESFFAIGVDVVGDGGATKGDGFF
jgi:hypothetical protein